MIREPEPELMDGEAQARVYAAADLANASWLFVEYFKKNFSERSPKTILDLGCGPADITLRLAEFYPHSSVHGLDGAANMLEYGNKAIQKSKLDNRVHLIHGKLGKVLFPLKEYEAVISNSFLHHLANPALLWQIILEKSRSESCVMVMDLLRPGNKEKASEVVDAIMPDEPDILRDDFFRSLCAAYTMEEVDEQLIQAGLAGVLSLSRVSPIQFMVHGELE